MLNTQPHEANRFGERNAPLEVHSIFDTIQGEGPYAGMPATFIRLAGCNLRCSHCDTDYTSQRTLMTVDQILAAMNEHPLRGLVVLTGGEPLRQDVSGLILDLLETRRVQIETNGLGALWFDDPLMQSEFKTACKRAEHLRIVCSPKTREIGIDSWDYITDLKYVVSHDAVSKEDGLPLLSVGRQYGAPARPPVGWKGGIYVQPLDSKDVVENEKNMQAAVQSCLQYGYRLCLQMQKIVNLP